MAGKYSSSDYMDAQALQVMGQLSGAIEGLIPQQGRRPIHPLQQNAIGAGGAPDLNCCAVVPTHCFRTVSQRSLSGSLRLHKKHRVQQRSPVRKNLCQLNAQWRLRSQKKRHVLWRKHLASRSLCMPQSRN